MRTKTTQLCDGITPIAVEEGPLARIFVARQHHLLDLYGCSIKPLARNSNSILPSCEANTATIRPIIIHHVTCKMNSFNHLHANLEPYTMR